ncbi:hypothetical protein [Ralstonia solanacearum]|uniref:hypothetical protein n=1 Tax=Ralstonia solanacearum TaxID=305 RepID=UPI0018C2D2A4|nr:hypothetical protein [Ralstonia solanacearum]
MKINGRYGSTTRQLHRCVDGLLFEARMPWGAVTVLGIPFEHVGRLWSVHGAVSDGGHSPTWVVSDVETGAKVPGVAAQSTELACAAATELLDALGADKLQAVVQKFAAGGKSSKQPKRRKVEPMPLTPALQQR